MEEADYNFSELIHNESFKRWVDGNASPQEKQYWDKWVMKSPETRALAIRAQEHIAGFTIEPSSQPSQDEAWNHVKEKMDADRSYVSSISQNTGLQWVYRVAAVFLLIAFTGLAISYITDGRVDNPEKNQMVRHEVVTDYGEQKSINLSDGSEIMLNAHSSLVYTIDPADSNAVEVFLDGEAHFSVAKRKDPTDAAFRVKTSSGLVKVMGTQFAVSTRNQDTQVVLEEGKVSLSPLNRNEETIMEPGQLASFNANSDRVHKEFVNTEVYTSWRTPMLVFDQTPLTDLIDRLENTFGVKVVVRKPDLYKREISGSIDNSDLEVITDALSNTLNTPIEVTDNAVYVGEKLSNKN